MSGSARDGTIANHSLQKKANRLMDRQTDRQKDNYMIHHSLTATALFCDAPTPKLGQLTHWMKVTHNFRPWVDVNSQTCIQAGVLLFLSLGIICMKCSCLKTL